MGISPRRVVELVIPPALLSYFVWAWRRCTFLVGYTYLYKHLGRPYLGLFYSGITNLSIVSMSLVFLRLYFLPAGQNVPPRTPPRIVRTELFECATQEGEYVLVPHGEEAQLELELDQFCSRGKCAPSRWKPARTRHCSACGVCRTGFDHHCAFFANCLTAPYLPAFLSLCLFTPLTVLALSPPLLQVLGPRAAAAWRTSATDPTAVAWWSWRPGWLVPAGPVGRWCIGLALGWRALDAADGGAPAGILRLELGVATIIGFFLGAITAALGISTLMHIRAGALTVDAERVRSYNAAKADLAALNLPPGAAPPPALAVRLARFSPRQWFFVPVKDSRYAGVVLPSPTDAYDLGPADNVALALGPKGLAALLPWNAVAPARSFADMVAWPLSPVARLHLETEAQRIVDEAKTTAA